MKDLSKATSVILLFVCFSILYTYADNYKEWKAPPETDKYINPLKGNSNALAEGKKIFVQNCIICHGEKGKGDGIGSIGLNPKPANFSKPAIQAQSDGALFWKISEGRLPMASYKAILTESQRWQVINYIRTFKQL